MEYKEIIGQFTDAQFRKMYEKASNKGKVNNGAIFWIKYGEKITNYFYQHQDNSWSNFAVKK